MLPLRIRRRNLTELALSVGPHLAGRNDVLRDGVKPTKVSKYGVNMAFFKLTGRHSKNCVYVQFGGKCVH